MATDRSRNQTPGGGGQGQGQRPAQVTSSSGVRLRAEEVVERGLRLYAHGDLIGALAEWRRALEIDRGNRRGRDYVTYVEEHFEVLNEKFRAARERRGHGAGPAIEMEADDPMDDIQPYESIELEGAAGERDAGDDQAEAGEGDGDREAIAGPAPEAPQLHRMAAVGKHAAGRRPWGRPSGARDADDFWPGDESWPSTSRSDTLEMAMNPSCLDDMDDLAISAAPEGGLDDDEDDDGDESDREARLDQEDDELAADEDNESGAGRVADPATGDITLPAPSRRRIRSERGGPSAEGSGPLEPWLLPRTGDRPAEPGGQKRFDLSEFGSSVPRPHPRARPADEEAWADGTPPAEDVGEESLAHLRELRELHEEELREVRVTFRRPLAGRSGPLPEDEPRGVGGAPTRIERAGRGQDHLTALRIVDSYDRADSEGDFDDEDDEDERTAERAALPRFGAGRRQPPTGAAMERLRERLPRVTGEGSDLAASAERKEPSLPLFEEPDSLFDTATSAERPASRARQRAAAEGEMEGEGEAIDLAVTQMRTRLPLAHSAVSIDLVSTELLNELDADMGALPPSDEDLLRERIGWLIERAGRENQAGRYQVAVVAVDLALSEDPESAVAQKLIHTNRDLLFEIYGNYLGDTSAVPGLALPMSAIPMSELDHRSAFILSRVDGVLSLEDVLDVSGMARLEAFRHLSRLMLRGILEIRP